MGSLAIVVYSILKQIGYLDLVIIKINTLTDMLNTYIR